MMTWTIIYSLTCDIAKTAQPVGQRRVNTLRYNILEVLECLMTSVSVTWLYITCASLITNMAVVQQEKPLLLASVIFILLVNHAMSISADTVSSICTTVHILLRHMFLQIGAGYDKTISRFAMLLDEKRTTHISSQCRLGSRHKSLHCRAYC